MDEKSHPEKKNLQFPPPKGKAWYPLLEGGGGKADEGDEEEVTQKRRKEFLSTIAVEKKSPAKNCDRKKTAD